VRVQQTAGTKLKKRRCLISIVMKIRTKKCRTKIFHCNGGSVTSDYGQANTRSGEAFGPIVFGGSPTTISRCVKHSEMVSITDLIHRRGRGGACERIQAALSRSCNLERASQFCIRVAVHTAIKVADQPFVEIHDLRAAATLVAQFEAAIATALQRAARLHPARPFMQRLTDKLPRHHGCGRRARLQMQDSVHIDSDR
jgi:hypothetical protein